MAAIIAPIVARDEAETMLIKSANRTIQVCSNQAIQSLDSKPGIRNQVIRLKVPQSEPNSKPKLILLINKEWERPKGPIASSWNVIQTKFECCGVENFKNWQNSKKFVEYAKVKLLKTYAMTRINDSLQKENATATFPVPDSCCIEKTENCGFEYNDETMIYSQGCIKKIGKYLSLCISVPK